MEDKSHYIELSVALNKEQRNALLRHCDIVPESCSVNVKKGASISEILEEMDRMNYAWRILDADFFGFDYPEDVLYHLALGKFRIHTDRKSEAYAKMGQVLDMLDHDSSTFTIMRNS